MIRLRDKQLSHCFKLSLCSTTVIKKCSVNLRVIFYVTYFSDPYFIANSSLLWRIVFVTLSMMVVRLKFYFAWIVGKIINREIKMAGY